MAFSFWGLTLCFVLLVDGSDAAAPAADDNEPDEAEDDEEDQITPDLQALSEGDTGSAAEIDDVPMVDAEFTTDPDQLNSAAHAASANDGDAVGLLIENLPKFVDWGRTLDRVRDWSLVADHEYCQDISSLLSGGRLPNDRSCATQSV